MGCHHGLLWPEPTNPNLSHQTITQSDIIKSLSDIRLLGVYIWGFCLLHKDSKPSCLLARTAMFWASRLLGSLSIRLGKGPSLCCHYPVRTACCLHQVIWRTIGWAFTNYMTVYFFSEISTEGSGSTFTMVRNFILIVCHKPAGWFLKKLVNMPICQAFTKSCVSGLRWGPFMFHVKY